MTVHVVATGGTISSHFDGTEWTNLTGAQLVEELGPLPVDVVVHEVASGPSSNLSVDQMVGIARTVASLLVDGATGVVVVHGTDTIELTAFVAQLLLGTDAHRRPVVFTGSMRVHSHARPDGPANLRNAIAVASSPAAVGREVMVCLDGTVHAADRVTKHNATSLDAFHSAPFAPIGSVRDGVPEFIGSPSARRVADRLAGPVPLLTAYPGLDAAELEAVLAEAPGVVVEGFGNLNVPQSLWGPIHAAWRRGCLVVLASRPFTPTSATADLDLLGAVGAGGLTAQKARLATMAALSCGNRGAAIEFLHHLALGEPAPADPALDRRAE
jgi:L-asparaginase